MSVADSLRIANEAWNDGAWSIGLGAFIVVMLACVIAAVAYEAGSRK